VIGTSGYSTVHFFLGMYDSVTPIPWMIALVDSITSVMIDMLSPNYESQLTFGLLLLLIQLPAIDLLAKRTDRQNRQLSLDPAAADEVYQVASRDLLEV